MFFVHHRGLLLALHLHLHLQLHLLLDLHLHGVRVLLFLRGLLADSPRTLGVPGRPRRVPVKGVVDLAVTVVALMTRLLVLRFELGRVRELALGERVVMFGLRLDDGGHPCTRGVDCRGCEGMFVLNGTTLLFGVVRSCVVVDVVWVCFVVV